MDELMKGGSDGGGSAILPARINPDGSLGRLADGSPMPAYIVIGSGGASGGGGGIQP